jgi:sugar/nucleoside kinase (ribokinase family)
VKTNRFVSIADLVADVYYDKNVKPIGVDGGITAHNIICNLQNMGFDTLALGVCGNDFLGKISIRSLTDCNVKNDILIRNNMRTKAYHIRRIIENGRYTYRSIKYCPYCKESSWYEGSCIDEKSIIKKIKEDDILVLDNLNEKNQYIIDNTKNIKLIDLGTCDEFENLSKDQIIKKISNKFEIVNLNERVEKYLIQKLDCKDSIDLSKIFSSKLLMITRGEKGNEFVFKAKKYCFPLKKIIIEVDDSGAGDAFFSTIIKNWMNNDKTISEEDIEKWFNDSTKLINKILRLVGSRRHIKKMYPIKKKDICKEV